ncbi:malic enzyme-like NAD(P)-binding protein [Streptomyces microflavus]|uniref:malic enzyme-like NAD(P)-binding protein n=1 Tax=Streptomyces microflavus TaxID=1919 RepID=UPI003666807A
MDLAEVVKQIHPTILIGTSTTPGRFTEAIVKEMAAPRPIIFPLSNPTPLSEATPEQLLGWTAGKALVATGSPFDDVEVNGTSFRIGQANNAALYPGLGLGSIVAKAQKVTDGMILAAAQAVAGQTDLSAPGAALLPSNGDLRVTSSIVALAVIEAAKHDGVGGDLDNPVGAVQKATWWPTYRPVVAE